ncbi:hypothetical protein Aduo_012353 [Ancylostoma duodenale]
MKEAAVKIERFRESCRAKGREIPQLQPSHQQRKLWRENEKRGSKIRLAVSLRATWRAAPRMPNLTETQLHGEKHVKTRKKCRIIASFATNEDAAPRIDGNVPQRKPHHPAPPYSHGQAVWLQQKTGVVNWWDRNKC